MHFGFFQSEHLKQELSVFRTVCVLRIILSRWRHISGAGIITHPKRPFCAIERGSEISLETPGTDSKLFEKTASAAVISHPDA